MKSWKEWQCKYQAIGNPRSCPCGYPTSPIINIWGLCPDTLVEHSRYKIKQLPSNPMEVFMVGYQSAQIKYDHHLSEWILEDKRQGVTAKSQASHMSFALGRSNWTISGDDRKCSRGKEYTVTLKLSACKDDEFTCNSGHCVKMVERCDRLPNCQDESDEIGCKVLVLKESYNKRVPPVGVAGNEVKTTLPAIVMISLTLYKVVAINEEDLSIEFQFLITLEWKENRASYHNLKQDSYFNALTDEEINSIWLPQVVYTNTDQQETTRLGWVNEWSTYVRVKKQGNSTRSGFEMVDETEVFKGKENSLVMTQTYTHEFQCVFLLERYPFDTQVSKTLELNNFFRSALLTSMSEMKTSKVLR